MLKLHLCFEVLPICYYMLCCYKVTVWFRAIIVVKLKVSVSYTEIFKMLSLEE